MSHPDASIWNARYASELHSSQKSPRELVTSHLSLLPPGGLILDVACGLTPTGLYLARRGWRVIALDVAEAALRRIQPQVQQESLPLSLAVMDLMNPWLPAGHFDVVLNFYFLSREIWRTYRKALKPGGLLFFETFFYEPESDMNPAHFLQDGELQAAFQDWEILHYAEILRPHHDAPTHKRRVARLIARKPKEQE
jgi:SAM-dependent methyltransferase